MKRFLLFTGHDHPYGGCSDFHSSHETFLGAMTVVCTLDSVYWWHILDTRTGMVSREGEDCSPLEERA